MRSAVDPDESQYYQAIVWVSERQPPHFEQLHGADTWAGVRWFNATLDTLPDTRDCSVALLVLEDVSGDDMPRVPDMLQRLRSAGTLVGLVVVFGVSNAKCLHEVWSAQVAVSPSDHADEYRIPIIVGVGSREEAWAVLRFLNQFTYSAMLACVDWYDVSALGEMAPYHYRHIVSRDYVAAAAELVRSIDDKKFIPMMILAESPSENDSVAHMTDLCETVDQALTSENNLLVVSVIWPASNSAETEIHWLEAMP